MNKEYHVDGFSIIMPTYNQSEFIRRAILSVIEQTYASWELIIVDDGCTDGTEENVKDYLETYNNIIYIRNQTNKGMGHAINQGLAVARYSYIAYLPSDDFYYVNHLQDLKERFEESGDIVLVYSGMRYDLNDTVVYSSDYQTLGVREGYSLQLAQTAHRKTEDRWVERDEWVTDDLYRMFWCRLVDKGAFIPTNKISAYWTNHPNQRHKIISEKYGGGINPYRSFYHVRGPIKIHVSDYKFTDEEEIYKNFRHETVPSKDCLKILLVGELAFNPDRIYAFEEAGHQLYGLWMQRPTYCSTTVGPLPFGNVTDIPHDDYQNKIKEIKPDIIYALLNFGAIPLAYEVCKNFPDIPFVWHFKESSFHAIREGKWKELVYLYSHADGKIFINEEVKAWFEQFIPGMKQTFILDGDLPKKDYFDGALSKRLSETDNEIHTVLPGRNVGINDELITTMARESIHLHIYTENFHNQRMGYLRFLQELAPQHLHLHPHCAPENWLTEFSQYDAGWLHCFESENGGNVLNANWNDLNIPARLTTLAMAGLPMIQKDNSDHLVAMQTIAQKKDVGIFFKDADDLCRQLKDKKRMAILQENILKHRYEFSFDYHLPALISFFRDVIREKTRGM
ncbi:glycosyltransferase family 2 protein [Bacteroides thetaiotaomicron]|jgi:glycosyltransferase, family 2|nr:glycosyltransferase family 2 protein [Bacteroides thetaiotaomicron]